ncbi:MAG: murein biosynthesis integral membrane protein MurJ, partial [Ktedonobacteraceae bacterium]
LSVPPLEEQDTGSMQKMRMARATMILTGSFIVGRILGLLRTSIFAFVFGTTITSDAYLQAFLIPDLIFNVVAGGALSSAFIPVFTHYMLGEKDEKGAWHVASSALNLALAIMCCLALLAIILAPQLVPLYNQRVPAAELSLIITLTRIMLVQSIIMGGGVILNSVLYSRQNFMLPAIGTVLYNVGLIVGLLPGFFLVFFGRSEAHLSFAVYAATIGVVLGAILQVGIQIPGIIKERMRYSFAFDWKHPGVRQIGRQMLPRVLNAAMLYFSTFVDRGLILLLAAGVFLVNKQDQQGLVTQYYQALQLVLLPLGIFGMAISTAAFPTMAENVTLGRLDRVRAIIEDTLRTILFLSIPASVGLIVLGLPIIQVLLQHGAFGLASATATSVPLAFFAFGLAGLAAVEILTRSFYAFRDSKTPVLVSVAQFILKILLSLMLLNLVKWGPSWSLGMLAFSTSVASLLEAAVLLWLLQKKLGMLRLRQLANFSGRVLLAALAMGVGVLLLRT